MAGQIHPSISQRLPVKLLNYQECKKKKMARIFEIYFFSQGPRDPTKVLFVHLPPGKWLPSTFFSFPIRLLLPTAVDQGLEVVAAVAPLVQPGWIELDTKIFSSLHLFLPIHPSRNNLTHLMQPYHCALLFPLPTSTNFKTSNRPGSCSVFLRMHFHCSCRSSRGKT